LRTDRPAAECQDLVKVYRTAASSVHALRGVTARFPRGVMTAVAGPSGSGKSSLMRLLAGLDRPDSGRLFVDDVRVDRASSRSLRRLRRRSVGYVFQRASDNFFPHLTVGEHLSMATIASGRPAAVEPEEVLEILGIEHRVDHRPAELSGGEQARAAMAQILVGGSTIVVADEPTAELDTASAASLLQAVEEVVERGVTFVIASHDAAVIQRSDHVVELEHGVLPRKARARSEHVPIPPLRSTEPAELEDLWDRSRRTSLDARSVTKTYRRGSEEVHAVRDASFTIFDGELVGLVGRSGSGKTTLLNIAAGWERPDSGHLSVVGMDPSRELPTWDEVAVLPQRLGLIAEFTIRENIEYPARLANRLGAVSWLIDGLIDALGLRSLQDRYPKEVSVGEQQRAGLARALVLSPRLLLADEPTGHQNAEWAEAMFGTLREGTMKGTSCLAASHDEALLRYVDRVLAMSDGTLTPRAADA
jgi:putative ABC transport system ATP-binding protein